MKEENQMVESRKARQKRIGDIVGGILGVLFGLFLVLQFPFRILSTAHPMFLGWVRLFGVLIIVRSFYGIVQSIIQFRNIWLKRGVYAAGELLGLLAIPLFFWLREHVGIVPGFEITDDGFRLKELSMTAAGVLYWVFTGIAVLSGIGAAVGVVRAFLMKGEDDGYRDV
jgi:hypothetical protein